MLETSASSGTDRAIANRKSKIANYLNERCLITQNPSLG